MLFACVVFVLLFWRNFPLRKALIGDSVDSEGQGLWLGRGLWGDSWPLTLHKEDMEPQHLGRRLGLLGGHTGRHGLLICSPLALCLALPAGGFPFSVV